VIWRIIPVLLQKNNQKSKMKNLSVSVTLTSELRLEQALKEAGVENPASVTKLTISGIIGRVNLLKEKKWNTFKECQYRDDFWYINQNMGKTLQELDLGEALVDEMKILHNCGALKSVTFPASLLKFHSWTFPDKPNWSGLTNITVHPDNPVYTSRDGVLFNKDMTELVYYPQGRQGNYVIPASVRKILRNAFTDCFGLTSITIPASVVEIELGVFCGCTGLTEVVIPASVTYLSTAAFQDCSGLTSVILPDTLTIIGNSAFNGCTNLKSIIVPASVRKIEHCTFLGCTGLTAVTIPNSVVEIEWGSFGGCTSLSSVFIPASVVEIDKEAFEGCDAIISVHPDNPVYASKKGKLIKSLKIKKLKELNDLFDVPDNTNPIS